MLSATKCNKLSNEIEKNSKCNVDYDSPMTINNLERMYAACRLVTPNFTCLTDLPITNSARKVNFQHLFHANLTYPSHQCLSGEDFGHNQSRF